MTRRSSPQSQNNHTRKTLTLRHRGALRTCSSTKRTRYRGARMGNMVSKMPRRGLYKGTPVEAKTNIQFPELAKIQVAHSPKLYTWWSDRSSPPTSYGTGILNSVTGIISQSVSTIPALIRQTVDRVNWLQSRGYKITEISSTTNHVVPRGNSAQHKSYTSYIIHYRAFTPEEKSALAVRDNRKLLCAWYWKSVVSGEHQLGKMQSEFGMNNRNKIDHLSITWDTSTSFSAGIFDNIFNTWNNTVTTYVVDWFYA